MFFFFIDIFLAATGYFLIKSIIEGFAKNNNVLYLEYIPNESNDDEVPPRYENTNLLEPIEENQKEEPPKY